VVNCCKCKKLTYFNIFHSGLKATEIEEETKRTEIKELREYIKTPVLKRIFRKDKK